MTAEFHRVTSFKIFLDLVFVFAITRVVSFMARSLTAATLARGLILLSLLWWSWAAYVWLGNRVCTSPGLAPAASRRSDTRRRALAAASAWLRRPFSAPPRRLQLAPFRG
jgi:hypothetical protein